MDERYIPEISKKLKNKELYDSWYNLVDRFKDDLDRNALYGEESYTPHGYIDHCMNIYKILYEIIPDSFYETYSEGVNLYILMVSVLLHDHIMCIENSEAARREHSLRAKNWIMKEMNLVFRTVVKSSSGEDVLISVADVIYAHSNIKYKKSLAKEPYNTFIEVVEKHSKQLRRTPKGSSVINVPILAALLRLADELDITHSRMEKAGVEYKSKTDSSKPHYDKLLLFSNVLVKEDCNDTLLLSLRTDGDLFNDKSSATYNAHLITEVYDKVKERLDEVQKHVFQNPRTRLDGFNITKIELHDFNGKAKNIEYYRKKAESAKKKIRIINETSKKITDIVRKNKIVSTDILVEKSSCKYNHWIHIKELFTKDIEVNESNISVMDYIAEEILKELENNYYYKKYENKYIIGIDFYGALLSAAFSLKCKIPFSYIILDQDNQEKVYRRETKKEVADDVDELLILITDVYTTGNTISKTLKRLNKEGIGKKYVILVSIFHRGPLYTPELLKLYNKQNIKSVIILNDACEYSVCNENEEDCPFIPPK